MSENERSRRCVICGGVVYQPSALRTPPPYAPWIHAGYVATDHDATPDEA